MSRQAAHCCCNCTAAGLFPPIRVSLNAVLIVCAIQMSLFSWFVEFERAGHFHHQWNPEARPFSLSAHWNLVATGGKPHILCTPWPGAHSRRGQRREISAQFHCMAWSLGARPSCGVQQRPCQELLCDSGPSRATCRWSACGWSPCAELPRSA